MGDLLKPRTMFAALFYGTFCYLVATQQPTPDILDNICMGLLAFYFGQRSKKEVKKDV